MTDNNTENVLAKKIAEGTASREERGIALKTINTQLAIDMVTGLDDVKEYLGTMKKLRAKMSEKFIKKIEEQLECDELDPELMYQYMNSISTKELQLVEAYRKLIQGGRALFDEDTLSEEDRTVIRLLRSFSTNDEKSKFFNLVTQYLRDKNFQDAHIVE